MTALLSRAVLLLSLLGLVTGNLYRPCDCADDAAAAGHDRCCATHEAPARPACCHDAASEDRNGDDGGDPHGDCTICCKPRAPLGETQDVVEVPAPLPHGIVADLPVVAAWDASTPGGSRPVEAGRRTGDPWLLSPEGLTVFLI